MLTRNLEKRVRIGKGETGRSPSFFLFKNKKINKKAESVCNIKHSVLYYRRTLHSKFCFFTKSKSEGGLVI